MYLQLHKNGPVGALYIFFQNWWIIEKQFFDWLLHFKHFAKLPEDGFPLMTGTAIKIYFNVSKGKDVHVHKYQAMKTSCA
jgi:hypothetical protein